MTFEQRRDAALALLDGVGVARMWSTPLYTRLLWALGLRVPPPHFAGVLANFLWIGGYGLVVMMIGCWWVVWSKRGASLESVLAAASFPIIFGLVYALAYHRVRRRLRLPAWSEMR